MGSQQSQQPRPALERVKLLLTIEEQVIAACETKESLSKVEALSEQIPAVTEQVAAFVAQCRHSTYITDLGTLHEQVIP